jgi:beta-glucosidase
VIDPHHARPRLGYNFAVAPAATTGVQHAQAAQVFRARTAFGYGLSYTQFEYSEVAVDRPEIRPGESLAASVTVTNTGQYAGEEVVQLYVRDLVGSVTRPVRQLAAFQKIHLEKGESREVAFMLGEADLAFYRHDMSWGAEPGEFRLYIGTSSRDVSEAGFTLLPADAAGSRTGM